MAAQLTPVGSASWASASPMGELSRGQKLPCLTKVEPPRAWGSGEQALGPGGQVVPLSYAEGVAYQKGGGKGACTSQRVPSHDAQEGMSLVLARAGWTSVPGNTSRTSHITG